MNMKKSVMPTDLKLGSCNLCGGKSIMVTFVGFIGICEECAVEIPKPFEKTKKEETE